MTVGPCAAADWPDYETLRFDEDYSQFRDDASTGLWPAKLKHIPLADTAGSAYVSLGGELRERFEYTHNPVFGDENQNQDHVWLQRILLHGDFALSAYARVFLQLSSALQSGRTGGPSPVDENRLEWQNAFFDVKLPLDSGARLRVRPGRQELRFGSGRLIDVREGPNVRRTFDALRGDLLASRLQLTSVYARPRQTESGAFDDRRDDDQRLYGFYSTTHLNARLSTAVDAYYLRFDNDKPDFVQTVSNERRHSFGIRVFGGRHGFDWNWEAVYQTGGYAGGDIRAWTLAGITGYRWETLTWKPRFGLSTNIASGDDDPGDDELKTFNPLFPRGNYFSEASVLGPRNFINIQPSIGVTPRPDWTLSSDINFFWRLEKNDGIYTPGGQIVRLPQGSNERYVGTALSLNSEWQAGRHWTFTAIYTRFEPGDFIKDTGDDETIDFVELTARYRF